MDQKTTDTVVAIAVVTVLASGGLLTWQALQRQQSRTDTMGGMMDGSTSMQGTDPVVYVAGTLIAAALLVGLYAVFRDATSTANTSPVARGQFDSPEAAARPSAGPSTDEGEPTDEDEEDSVGRDDETAEPDPSGRLLAVLPEDERRILGPVVDSPGLTQIELRDRADFSKSKVSQTVSDLEKRGLLYREKQGRTYRVYPGDELDEGHTESA